MNLDPEIASLLNGFPVIIEVPIWWGDQDAFGHVNNTVPLRWFESARIAYSSRVGLSDLMPTHRIGPILASITANYRKQLRFPDTVLVGARITRIGRTSLTMDHAVISRDQRALAVDGTSTLVVFDYARNSPEPVPAAIRLAIETLEARAFG